MKTLTLVTGTKQVALIDREEPSIQASDEVKLKVLEVGICATDKELIQGARGVVPLGERDLIIGHEMLGQVIEIGSKVSTVQMGDLAVFTVRRGCGACIACRSDHFDLCVSGNYLERGIKGLHGFQAEMVVDRETHLVKLPHSIRSFGVLCEPASVVEKAMDVGLQIESIHGGERKVLIAGVGSLGLLAAMIAKLRGFEVFGYDIVDPGSLRPSLLEQMGGKYLYGKEGGLPQLFFDLIIETAGVAVLDLKLLSALAPNGVSVFTGIPERGHPIEVDLGGIMQHIVLNNQVLRGSVNASKKHWAQAVLDLEKGNQLFNGIVEKLITERVPIQGFQKVFSEHSINDIKKVITWTTTM